MTPQTSAAEAQLRIAALATDPHVHQAFGWLHLHEPQLRRWQLEFLAIPAPSFAEAERACWFRDRFEELGLGHPHIDGEGNALAELGSPQSIAASKTKLSGIEPSDVEANGVPHVPLLGHGIEPPRISDARISDARISDEAAPILLLSAHLDTVFPAGTDCTPRSDETHAGPIRGPGACDNGAGLTALLGLAAALKHAAIAPACTILFCANAGEEGEGDLRGMRHLFTASPYSHRIKAAIALEGSGAATVVDRALGSRRLRVTISGPGGHSWADAGRPNPILALASALLAAADLPLPGNPRTTLNCGVIRGGTSVNSIPESASADLDLRSTSSLQLDRTELAILQTLTASIEAGSGGGGGALQLPRLQLQVARIGDRPAAALPATSALAASLRAVDRHLHLETDARIGSTDANLPLSLGVPALAIGAGGSGGGIHTLAEWYDPTGRDLALRRILLLLLDLCTLASSGHLRPVRSQPPEPPETACKLNP